jgi:hypothetical protein
MTVESFLQKQQDTCEALFYLVEAINKHSISCHHGNRDYGYMEACCVTDADVSTALKNAEAILETWETPPHIAGYNIMVKGMNG